MTALPHHRYQGLAKGSGNLQAVASSVTRSDMGLSKNLFEDNYHGIPKTGNFWGNTWENMGHVLDVLWKLENLPSILPLENQNIAGTSPNYMGI